MMRRTGVWLGGAVGLAMLCISGGCEDVALNLGTPPRQTPKPAPAALRPATRPENAAPPRNTAVTPPPPAVAPEPPVEVSFQQVILLSEAAPADAPPGTRYVRLSSGGAREVACVLSWLYLPCGPAGTDTRYCLVYPTAREADMAARRAAEIDVASIVDARVETPTSSEVNFGRAVGLLYGADPARPADRERLKAASSLLDLVHADAALPRWTRWAAAIIAGTLAMEQTYDFEAAGRFLAAAENLAEPGSYEQMAAWYAQARAHVQDGRPAAARAILGRILSQCGAFRETEVFERSRRMLAEFERRR